MSQAGEGDKAGTCRAWIALGGSDLYPERSGVTVKFLSIGQIDPKGAFSKGATFSNRQGEGGGKYMLIFIFKAFMAS